MISGVAPSVSFSPWTTIMALSPTRRQSTGVSARSARRPCVVGRDHRRCWVPAALAAANPSTEPMRGRRRGSGVLRAATSPPQFPIDGKPADRQGWTGVLFAGRSSLGVRRAWVLILLRPVAIVFAPDAMNGSPGLVLFATLNRRCPAPSRREPGPCTWASPAGARGRPRSPSGRRTRAPHPSPSIRRRSSR